LLKVHGHLLHNWATQLLKLIARSAPKSPVQIPERQKMLPEFLSYFMMLPAQGFRPMWEDAKNFILVYAKGVEMAWKEN
jgi:hypothetical protein